jgi:hypothetical protein
MGGQDDLKGYDSLPEEHKEFMLAAAKRSRSWLEGKSLRDRLTRVKILSISAKRPRSHSRTLYLQRAHLGDR